MHKIVSFGVAPETPEQDYYPGAVVKGLAVVDAITGESLFDQTFPTGGPRLESYALELEQIFSASQAVVAVDDVRYLTTAGITLPEQQVDLTVDLKSLDLLADQSASAQNLNLTVAETELANQVHQWLSDGQREKYDSFALYQAERSAFVWRFFHRIKVPD